MGQLISIKDICDNCVSNNWPLNEVDQLLMKTIPSYDGINKNLLPTYHQISYGQLSSLLNVNAYFHNTSLKYGYYQLVSNKDVTYNINGIDVNAIRIIYDIDNPEMEIPPYTLELHFEFYNENGEVINEIDYTGPSDRVRDENGAFGEIALRLTDYQLSLPTRMTVTPLANFSDNSYLTVYDGDVDREIYFNSNTKSIYLPYGLQYTQFINVFGNTVSYGDNTRRIILHVDNNYGRVSLSLVYAHSYTGYNDNWITYSSASTGIFSGQHTHEFVIDYDTLFDGNYYSFIKLEFDEPVSINGSAQYCTFSSVINENAVIRNYDNGSIIIEIPNWEEEYGDLIIGTKLE